MKREFASKKMFFAFAVMALAGWLAAPALADVPGTYTASITPFCVLPGSTATFTMTITNTATHNGVQIGAVTIDVPSGFTNVGSLTVAASGGQDWNAELSGSTIILEADHGNDKLNSGDFLTVTFTATAPSTTGDYTWTTLADESVVSSESDWTLEGSQPVVHVSNFCGFHPGDYCTFTQGGWGSTPHGNNPGALLAGFFSTVYPAGFVQVGGDATNNASPWGMRFTSATAVEAYLPEGGTPNKLAADHINPSGSPNATASEVFGGQVLALRLNVDFSANDIPPTPEGPLGDLDLVNYTPSSLNGQSIALILSAAELTLSGGNPPTGFTVPDLNHLVDLINNAFNDCTVVTDWANEHLTPGE